MPLESTLATKGYKHPCTFVALKTWHTIKSIIGYIKYSISTEKSHQAQKGIR